VCEYAWMELWIRELSYFVFLLSQQFTILLVCLIISTLYIVVSPSACHSVNRPISLVRFTLAYCKLILFIPCSSSFAYIAHFVP